MTRAPADGKERKGLLKRLREARGPTVDAAVAAHQLHLADRRKVRAALARGPATVPELAAACGVPSRTVLWHVAAMRKYGELVEDEQAGDYFRYRLADTGGRS